MRAIRKAAWCISRAAAVIEQPKLLLLAAKGVRLSLYEMLCQPYLRKMRINQILDIGANSGQFGTTLRAAFPGAVIHSFEPLPSCFEQLQKKIRNQDQWCAYPIALGDFDGQQVMEQNAFSASSSVLPLSAEHCSAFPYAGKTEPITVPMRRLDTVAFELQLRNQDNILIKLDVQGYEDRVIRGGGATFARTRAVIVETSFVRLYEGQPLFEDIHDQLRAMGFAYSGIISQEPSPSDGRPLFADSLFIKSL